MLTDSGGFQVFSHGGCLSSSPTMVVRFHRDRFTMARHVRWTPEDNMQHCQEAVGRRHLPCSLDQCTPLPGRRAPIVERAVEPSSSHVGASAVCAAHTRPDQALFGIVQGGMHLDLRLESVRRLRAIEDESLAAGGRRFRGFSASAAIPWAKSHEVDVRDACGRWLLRTCRADRPRYLMGVGNPTTLVRACGREGVDMFDCVLPTRTAPHGHGG